MFKVTFSAGTEKVETHPKYQTTSGSIEWTDSLEMSVNADDAVSYTHLTLPTTPYV